MSLGLEFAPSDLWLASLELWLALSQKINDLDLGLVPLDKDRSRVTVRVEVRARIRIRIKVRARVKHRSPQHLQNTNQMTHTILLTRYPIPTE